MTTYDELVAAHAATETEFYELFDAAGSPRPDAWTGQMHELASKMDELYDAMIDAQPWTTFVTCTGSSVVAVEAGETVATAAFEAHLGSDPFSRCGQCGDTNWTVGVDPTPDGADEVLYAADVAALLTCTDD